MTSFVFMAYLAYYFYTGEAAILTVMVEKTTRVFSVVLNPLFGLGTFGTSFEVKHFSALFTGVFKTFLNKKGTFFGLTFPESRSILNGP